MVLSSLRFCFLRSTRKQLNNIFTAKYSTEMSVEKYKTLAVSVPKEYVYMVQLNRPDKLNAMDSTMWREFKECFDTLATESNCRAIVLSGAGKSFCAGIDLMDAMQMSQELMEHEDIARKCKVLKAKITKYQDTFTSLEKCPKPVIAAVHGACIGAGIDMISAADIRYCSSDAWFQIKEVAIGMAADVGTLQRFPKIIGSDSLVRELVYTARKFSASEALKHGFVSDVFENQQNLMNRAIELAEEIAHKSPVAVQGSKLSLVYSRDHTVQEGLDHIAIWNQTMLQSEDFANAVISQVSKDEAPVFSKL